MTKKEAAIVSAYTGIMLGEFSDMHQYIEEILERPVWTHELANEQVVQEIKDKSRNDFVNIEVTG